MNKNFFPSLLFSNRLNYNKMLSYPQASQSRYGFAIIHSCELPVDNFLSMALNINFCGKGFNRHNSFGFDKTLVFYHLT